MRFRGHIWRPGTSAYASISREGTKAACWAPHKVGEVLTQRLCVAGTGQIPHESSAITSMTATSSNGNHWAKPNQSPDSGSGSLELL